MHYTVRAIRRREPFGLRFPEGRGEGQPTPLERPYEYLDAHERPVPWDVSMLWAR